VKHRLQLWTCNGLEWLCERTHFVTHHYPWLWVARWPSSYCSLAMVAFHLAEKWNLEEYKPDEDLTESES
jgi:hypothetical protein